MDVIVLVMAVIVFYLEKLVPRYVLFLRLGIAATTGNDLYLKIETRPGQRECSEVEVVADGSNLLNQLYDHVK